jgi:ribonuclease T2
MIRSAIRHAVSRCSSRAHVSNSQTSNSQASNSDALNTHALNRGKSISSAQLRCLAGLTVALPMLCMAVAGPVKAQEARKNEPGKFDFYVLSLSWSPSYCDTAGERAQQQPECQDRAYAFVVHGLWPQYEQGFPEFCQVPAPRLDRNTISSMLDLMPAPNLIFRGWDRHGTCTGATPRAYFDMVRKARAAVKIPAEYVDLKSTLTVAPGDIEEAFVKANPGMSRAAVAVSCDERLREVRVCLSKDLKFRDCAELDHHACRRDQVMIPPVRGRQNAADASTTKR